MAQMLRAGEACVRRGVKGGLPEPMKPESLTGCGLDCLVGTWEWDSLPPPTFGLTITESPPRFGLDLFGGSDLLGHLLGLVKKPRGSLTSDCWEFLWLIEVPGPTSPCPVTGGLKVVWIFNRRDSKQV